MGNAQPLEIKPDTNVPTTNGDGNIVHTEQVSDSVQVNANVNITTTSLFLIVLGLVFIAALIVFCLHHKRMNKINDRLHTLASLTGFGKEHLVNSETVV